MRLSGACITSRIDFCDPGPRDACESFCHGLLNKSERSLKTRCSAISCLIRICTSVRRRSEFTVSADITPLIVLRAEILRSHGVVHLEYLIYELNVAWDKYAPIATIVFSQPDHCVIFGAPELEKASIESRSLMLVISRTHFLRVQSGCSSHSSLAK